MPELVSSLFWVTLTLSMQYAAMCVNDAPACVTSGMLAAAVKGSRNLHEGCLLTFSHPNARAYSDISARSTPTRS